MFGPMINEANEPSSACRLWRIYQVETSTPPFGRIILRYSCRAVKVKPRYAKSSLASFINRAIGRRFGHARSAKL